MPYRSSSVCRLRVIKSECMELKWNKFTENYYKHACYTRVYGSRAACTYAMSKQQVRVASLLLREGFGSLVEEVGTHLLKHGASSLAEIVQATGLKKNQVHLQKFPFIT